MTVSTDAILFYGYWWDEETRNPWEIGRVNDDEDDNKVDNAEDGWEERYARTKGCLAPSTPFPDRMVTPTRENGWSSTPKDYSSAEQAIIDQYRAYWEVKRKLIEVAPCLVDTHCSASCPMPYVAVRASVTSSPRGYPTEISSLTVDPTWEAILIEFCATLGIEIGGKKPGWWLVSDWGE